MKQEPVRKADQTAPRQAPPGLTPFGMLAALFARDVFDRARVRIGAYQPLSLAFLDEEDAPAPAPGIELNLTFLLEKLKKARPEEGKQTPPAAAERRVLERLFRVEMRERCTRTLSVRFPELRGELRFAADRTAERYLSFEKTAPGAAGREIDLIRKRAEKVLAIAPAAFGLPSGAGAWGTDVTRFHQASVGRDARSLRPGRRAGDPPVFSRSAWNHDNWLFFGRKQNLSPASRLLALPPLSGQWGASPPPDGWAAKRRGTPPAPPGQTFRTRSGGGILLPQMAAPARPAAEAMAAREPAPVRGVWDAFPGRERREGFPQILSRLVPRLTREEWTRDWAKDLEWMERRPAIGRAGKKGLPDRRTPDFARQIIAGNEEGAVFPRRSGQTGARHTAEARAEAPEARKTPYVPRETARTAAKPVHREAPEETPAAAIETRAGTPDGRRTPRAARERLQTGPRPPWREARETAVGAPAKTVSHQTPERSRFHTWEPSRFAARDLEPVSADGERRMGEEISRQARLYDVGILRVLQKNATRSGGQWPATTVSSAWEYRLTSPPLQGNSRKTVSPPRPPERAEPARGRAAMARGVSSPVLSPGSAARPIAELLYLAGRQSGFVRRRVPFSQRRAAGARSVVGIGREPPPRETAARTLSNGQTRDWLGSTKAKNPAVPPRTAPIQRYAALLARGQAAPAQAVPAPSPKPAGQSVSPRAPRSNHLEWSFLPPSAFAGRETDSEPVLTGGTRRTSRIGCEPASRFDAGILCVFQGEATRGGGKRPAQTARSACEYRFSENGAGSAGMGGANGKTSPRRARRKKAFFQEASLTKRPRWFGAERDRGLAGRLRVGGTKHITPPFRNSSLPLPSQMAAAPSSGGWTPQWRQAYPGLQRPQRSGVSILLPDVMRMRRKAAQARSGMGDFSAWETVRDPVDAAPGRERRFLQTLDYLVARALQGGRTPEKRPASGRTEQRRPPDRRELARQVVRDTSGDVFPRSSGQTGVRHAMETPEEGETLYAAQESGQTGVQLAYRENQEPASGVPTGEARTEAPEARGIPRTSEETARAAVRLTHREGVEPATGIPASEARTEALEARGIPRTSEETARTAVRLTHREGVEPASGVPASEARTKTPEARGMPRISEETARTAVRLTHREGVEPASGVPTGEARTETPEARGMPRISEETARTAVRLTRREGVEPATGIPAGEARTETPEARGIPRTSEETARTAVRLTHREGVEPASGIPAGEARTETPEARGIPRTSEETARTAVRLTHREGVEPASGVPAGEARTEAREARGMPRISEETARTAVRLTRREGVEPASSVSANTEPWRALELRHMDAREAEPVPREDKPEKAVISAPSALPAGTAPGAQAELARPAGLRRTALFLERGGLEGPASLAGAAIGRRAAFARSRPEGKPTPIIRRNTALFQSVQNASPRVPERAFSRQELTFLQLPASTNREAAPADGDASMGLDAGYVKKLPQWARELLQKTSFAGAAENPFRFGAEQKRTPAPDAGGRAASPGAVRGGQIHWAAPGAARPGQTVSMFQTRFPDAASRPAAIEWKNRGEKETAGAPRPFSEAELRRTADRVYALIEERLRRELRRSGR